VCLPLYGLKIPVEMERLVLEYDLPVHICGGRSEEAKDVDVARTAIFGSVTA